MGSGTNSPSGLDSSSPLEIALDQAIARRFSSSLERPSKKRRNSPPPSATAAINTASIASALSSASVAPADSSVPSPSATAALPAASNAPSSSSASTALADAPAAGSTTASSTPVAASTTSTALALTATETLALAPIPARLSWKGSEVSEEFQRYAARVARGEELAPYRGQVLSRACADFPWGSPSSTTLPTPPRAESSGRRRSFKTLLWLGAGIASVVGGLSVGVGATAPSTLDGIDADRLASATAALTPTTALAPTPTFAPTTAPDEGASSPVQSQATDPAIEVSSLDTALPAPATLASPGSNAKAPATAPLAAPRAIGATPTPAVGALGQPNPVPGTTQLAIPPASPVSAAAGSPRPVIPSAVRALDPSHVEMATDSQLFSASPSF